MGKNRVMELRESSCFSSRIWYKRKTERNEGGQQAPDDRLKQASGSGPLRSSLCFKKKKVGWEQPGAKFSLRNVFTSKQLGTNPQLSLTPDCSAQRDEKTGREKVDRKWQRPQATWFPPLKMGFCSFKSKLKFRQLRLSTGKLDPTGTLWWADWEGLLVLFFQWFSII